MAPEIAIVGGGPAGLALAGLLEQNGIDYLVYERSAADTPPRGGCLDIHRSSGQIVLKEAGCFEEFKKYARCGDATVHWVWDHQGNKLFAFGEGRDSPEIDRNQLKRVLMSSIPENKIRWSADVRSSSRDDQGQIVLSLADGTTASGFKLVVGADGVRSKIRHLVTSVEPVYSDILFLALFILPSNAYHATLEQIAGQGPMVVLGKAKMIWIQRQGDGHYRLDFGWIGPQTFPADENFKLDDEDAVKEFLLQENYFGGHTKEMHDMIRAATGPFWSWPLYHFPSEDLNWASAPGVALIGDAAHVTPPFVGDGVNCAMRDSLILSQKLREFGITTQAVAEYEKEMFPYAADVISRSVAAGKLLFEWDSPKSFVQMMASDRPLVKFELDY
ncbi:Tetracycline resistance protein from transposon [Talaromyces pinophilus]|nr:Tetracycline resistance protein from transposon [Talaromyces pinophilus]